MLPATIKVAPKSPSARAKASTTPAASPRRASGKSHRAEDRELVAAQQPRNVFESRIDRLERPACRQQEQWKRSDSRGDDRARPVKNERDSQRVLEPVPEHRSPPEKLEQVEPHHGGRQDERQNQNSRNQ